MQNVSKLTWPAVTREITSVSSSGTGRIQSQNLKSQLVREYRQELIRRWDSERELFYNIAHVEASAYAHWTSS